MNEVWHPVAGYEGFYEVSSLGRVRRLGKDKALSQRTNDKWNYLKVCLCTNGKRKWKKVHRLVALNFVAGDHSLTVDHVDGNKHNNAAENLEWITLAEQQRRAVKLGLRKYMKISVEDRLPIYTRAQSGEAHRQIAADYSCSTGVIATTVYRFRKFLEAG